MHKPRPQLDLQNQNQIRKPSQVIQEHIEVWEAGTGQDGHCLLAPCLLAIP